MTTRIVLLASLLSVSASAQTPEECGVAANGVGSQDVVARGVAHATLKTCGGTAVPLLVAKLGDPNLDTAFFSVRLLAEMGAPADSAVPKLMELLKHKDLDVEAATAIAKIRPAARAEVVPVFLRHLESKNHDTAASIFDFINPLELWRDMPVDRLLRQVSGRHEDVRDLTLTLFQENGDFFADKVKNVAPLARCGVAGLKQDCYLEEGSRCRFVGDYDADGKPDIAVLVSDEATKKRGIAVLFASNKCVLAGAGKTLGAGGSDFQWMQEWNVRYRPRGKGTAIGTAKGDTGVVIHWSGGALRWEERQLEQ